LGSFSCDLHIHSVLSPCGSLDMSPGHIVEQACKVGLDIIAITDHNMVENGYYAYQAAKNYDLTILFGMELQTVEEIHMLAIFDDFETALDFQNLIYNLLPDVKNDVDYFGDQVVVDASDEIIRCEERFLLNSAQISINDAVKWIKSNRGLAIPSHIDSPTFSILSQLGFVPDDIPFNALEVSLMDKATDLLPLIMLKRVPFVAFSDAHYPADIGRRRTLLDMDKANCQGIAKALETLGMEV
jgi:3',5'-nucleoside bisphosphate phosphatase